MPIELAWTAETNIIDEYRGIKFANWKKKQKNLLKQTETDDPGLSQKAGEDSLHQLICGPKYCMLITVLNISICIPFVIILIVYSLDQPTFYSFMPKT